MIVAFHMLRALKLLRAGGFLPPVSIIPCRSGRCMLAARLHRWLRTLLSIQSCMQREGESARLQHCWMTSMLRTPWRPSRLMTPMIAYLFTSLLENASHPACSQHANMRAPLQSAKSPPPRARSMRAASPPIRSGRYICDTSLSLILIHLRGRRQVSSESAVVESAECGVLNAEC